MAEQIKEVLSGGSARTAVNIPSLKPQKLEPVKEYMTLAENLGELAMQSAEGNLKSIEITVNGNLADLDVSPLETAILKGVLGSFLVDVNYVNAPVIAKTRGLMLQHQNRKKVVITLVQSRSNYAQIREKTLFPAL